MKDLLEVLVNIKAMYEQNKQDSGTSHPDGSIAKESSGTSRSQHEYISIPLTLYEDNDSAITNHYYQNWRY